jgi:hypothetical protein
VKVEERLAGEAGSLGRAEARPLQRQGEVDRGERGGYGGFGAQD